MKNINHFFKTAVLCPILVLGQVEASCIKDQGPYEDEYGFAIFPFYNSCDEYFTISLCVKSYPPGSDTPVFNRYSKTAYGRSSIEISAGKWDQFASYRWDADERVACPFEEK